MHDDKLARLFAAEPYWIARAMREQGSNFFQKLGEALERADAVNRRKLYEAWTDECYDFYERGLQLEKAEA